jgi:hypothetical protein
MKSKIDLRGRHNNHKSVGRLRTFKELIDKQFRAEIERNAKFHKEAAMKWSGKQDWEALQDEFEQHHPNRFNTKSHNIPVFLFPTVEFFARYKADGDEDIERWINKSCGPTPKKEVEWKGDWALERATKRVKDMRHAQVLEAALAKDLGLMHIAAPVAASYRSWMEEPERMRSAVVEYLGGSVLEKKPKNWDRLTLKAKKRWRARQAERLEFYVGWIERITDYKAKVDTCYLDTIGYNKPNMQAIMQKFVLNAGTNNNGKGGLPNPESGDTREILSHKLLTSLVSMETEKAKIFDVPLPDEYQKLVDDSIEVEARGVEEED